jgi:hypothetical protein
MDLSLQGLGSAGYCGWRMQGFLGPWASFQPCRRTTPAGALKGGKRWGEVVPERRRLVWFARKLVMR